MKRWSYGIVPLTFHAGGEGTRATAIDALKYKIGIVEFDHSDSVYQTSKPRLINDHPCCHDQALAEH